MKSTAEGAEEAKPLMDRTRCDLFVIEESFFLGLIPQALFY